MKKSICIFLALLLLSFCAVPAFAADGEITALKINPYGGDEADIDTVSWFASSGKYFLFLPADTDLSAAKVYFTASGDVTLDGAPVASGESAAAFTAGAHTLSCGSRSYPLTVMLSANIPTVYLTTQSGSLDYIHTSKENKEPGSIRVYENGVKTTDSALKQIKGRGNSTWGLAKKPYNIKFDKKTALLGMPKAKKWTLLASYLDPQLISNHASWRLSEMLQSPVTIRSRHIDLYINGVYYGNYIICESVEIQSSRINIHDLEADNEDANQDDLGNIPAVGTGENGKVLSGAVPGSKKWIPMSAEPADVTGGYLLELDYAFRYDAEASGFVTENGQCVVIKSPEYASEAEVRYISAFFEEAWQALHSPTGTNAKGKHYSEYIDTDSLAAMYIVEEISKEVDCGLSSVFVYKDQGSQKLVFAPVWDFDQGNGNTGAHFYGVRINDPNTWLANSLCNGINWSGNKVFTPTVFRAAYRQESFRELVWNKWKAFTDANGVQEWTSYIEALAETLLPSATMNAERWNHYSSSPANRQTAYRNAVQTVLSYLRNRSAALSSGFSPSGAMIYYEPNGGSGFVFDGTIYSVGMDASVVAPDHTDWGVGLAVTPPTQELIFAGWNTKADGSGTSYQPGSLIRLSKKTTVLYAMWKTQAEIDAGNQSATQPTTQPAQPNNDGGDSGGDYLEWLRHILQAIIKFWRRVFRIK